MQPAAVPAMIGPYRVVRVLGTGGWSTVYEVVGPGGAETFACKRLRAELPEAALARFRREAESLRRIDHPGVLRLLDAGSDGGAPYLVTPRVDGASLRELLVRAGGALGIEAALLVAAGAAEALAAIHAAGLVHRDIKPENLMLAASGRVVVIDLGLALGPEHSRHTEENALTGSVPYMAPEQIEDRTPTPASDVWALAVVLYEAALGRRPFQRARQSEEVAAILAGKCEALAAADARCPDEVSALVARCLDHASDRRPADGAALARELAA
ncbi:MAG: serine/threonine protein kinase, partial [Deltaproteobacteria bacterium]|nr:serine/threonine protein kinase [Deltaproteobacteria bacterium]